MSIYIIYNSVTCPALTSLYCQKDISACELTRARCMVRWWWVVGSTPDSCTSLWYSLTRICAMKRRWRFRSLMLLGTSNIWCDSWCADPLRLGVRGRTRGGEGNCKSIYIRSHRACDKFASTDVFLAIWRREGGTRYNCACELVVSAAGSNICTLTNSV